MLLSVLVLLLCWILLACVEPATRRFFQLIHPGWASGDDASKKHVKKHVIEHANLFPAIQKEGENDMLALIVSFLLVQGLRFGCGHGPKHKLPEALGEEEAATLLSHEWLDIASLYMCSFGFMIGIFVSIQMHTKKEEVEWDQENYDILSDTDSEEMEEKGKISENVGVISGCEKFWMRLTDFKRLKLVMTNVWSMSFAWSFYWATVWFTVKVFSSSTLLVSTHEMNKEIDGTLLDILVAVIVSAIAFILIWALDALADYVQKQQGSDAGVDTVDNESIRKIINAVGVMIGFAWEKTFDKTVGDVGACLLFLGPFGKLFLMLVVVAVIAPAWVRYIIPMREEHGYRFGFVPRMVANRAKRAFTRPDEYKEDLHRLNEYMFMIKDLADVIPKEDIKKLAEQREPIMNTGFFKALLLADMIPGPDLEKLAQQTIRARFLKALQQSCSDA